jgi:AcrR family transcriptional regulator
VSAPAVRDAEKRAGPRPRRGSPRETRERLVLAAAREFEEHGYHGTDTNRIARAAGYAPGTFYKHFPDKRAAFIAVYEDWVAREWAGISEIVARRGTVKETAGAIADLVIRHHRAWSGFRASLRALVALDPEVRRVHRKWRRRQLASMQELGSSAWPPRDPTSEPAEGGGGRGRYARRGGRRPPFPNSRARPSQAIVLLVAERIGDALSDGEAASLGLDEETARAYLVERIAELLRS